MQDQAPRRRTQTERRKASEGTLLDAAAVVIGERGIEGASLASIGERAGTSRGLPTHHFGTKDALVGRLARRAQDGVAAATRSALANEGRSSEDLSALDLLLITVDTYLELFEHPGPDARALIVMWGATFPTAASIQGMMDADRRSYEGWTELIARGQHEGSIRSGVDPAAAAAVLFGMTRGVAALLLKESYVADVGSIRAICRAWVTAVLAPLDVKSGESSGRPRRPAKRLPAKPR